MPKGKPFGTFYICVFYHKNNCISSVFDDNLKKFEGNIDYLLVREIFSKGLPFEKYARGGESLNQYYPFINLVFTNQPCTRFHLEHLQRGKFKDIIDDCIKQGYIEIRTKNENGDDQYYITDKGQKIVDDPKEGIK